jgi:hypothetical protein
MQQHHTPASASAPRLSVASQRLALQLSLGLGLLPCARTLGDALTTATPASSTGASVATTATAPGLGSGGLLGWSQPWPCRDSSPAVSRALSTSEAAEAVLELLRLADVGPDAWSALHGAPADAEAVRGVVGMGDSVTGTVMPDHTVFSPAPAPALPSPAERPLLLAPAAEWSLFHAAAKHDRPQTAVWLLLKSRQARLGLEQGLRRTRHGYRPVMRPGTESALGHGYLERNALHIAVTHGNVGLLRALLAAGADVDARDRSGLSAMMLACTIDMLPCARLLLHHGADAEARDLAGHDATHLARKRGCGAAVEELLREHRAGAGAGKGMGAADGFVSLAAVAAADAGAAEMKDE